MHYSKLSTMLYSKDARTPKYTTSLTFLPQKYTTRKKYSFRIMDSRTYFNAFNDTACTDPVHLMSRVQDPMHLTSHVQDPMHLMSCVQDPMPLMSCVQDPMHLMSCVHPMHLMSRVQTPCT